MQNQIKKLLIYILISIFSYNAYAASTATCYDTTDTVLMLHMNGTDTSTTFTDSDDGAKSPTVGGNAQIDTAQSKFGGASGLFDGTGDYLQYATNADFALGTGEFTIDFWIRFNAVTNVTTYIWGTSDTSNRFDWRSTGRLDGYVGGTVGNTPTPFTQSTATWYHVAVVRTGTTAKIFIDGVERDSWTASGSIAQAGVTIAIYHDLSLFALNGWIDEFRIVKGTAVWTSGFTPPTAEYTDCAAGSGASQSSTFIGVSGTLQSY